MKWYKHDSDANMDSKLQEVLLDYGLEGYGLYWYCLELIVNKIDVDNLTFSLEHDARIIARNTGSTPQKVSEMMKRFVELGLFENSEGRITCMKLLTRLDKSMTSNPKFRNAIEQAKQSHDSVMINPDLVMQDKIRLEEKREEKKTDITQQAAPVFPDSEYLDQVASLWNSIMVTQPRIKLTASTAVAKKRVAAVKKIIKDYPDYKKPEYFENYFRELATCPNFAWQRENNQLNFDQATNINKFERNRSLMMKKYNMEETA